jgi:hypothetical protein
MSRESVGHGNREVQFKGMWQCEGTDVSTGSQGKDGRRQGRGKRVGSEVRKPAKTKARREDDQVR